MANQNQDILAIYKSLCDQQDALSAVIQQPSTGPQLAATISTEIMEIAHRIIVTQNLIFKEDSTELSSAVSSINASSKTLTTAIGQIQNAIGFVNSVSGYLADVDKAIDLAKTLASVA